MNFLHYYFLEFDFPFKWFLEKHREDMYRYYQSFDASLDFDMPINNSPINNFFGDKIKFLIEDNFYLKPTNSEIKLNLYVQTNNNSPSMWHTHIQSPSAICGVFYLDIPEEGGEFEFFHYPHITIEKPFRFKPKENKIYVFPPWLTHRPLPQKDSKPRFCINFQYISDSRPILKNYGYLW